MTTANDSQAALAAAMACHQQGDYYDADLHYSRALQLDPENLQALRLRAILARERGDMDLTLRLLEHALTLAPDDYEARAEAGLSKMLCGDLQGADDDLRAALRIAPNNIDLLTNFGALLQHRGHLHEAIAVYRDILQQDENEIEIRCNLAKVLADCGRTNEALAEAELAVKLAGGARGSLAASGAVLIDAARYTEAREALLRAIEIAPADDMTLVNLALCCTELDDLQAAATYLIRAVELNPHNARAVADLVNCLSAMGDDAQALSLAEGFLGEHPAERLVIGAYALALQNAGQSAAAKALTDSETLVQIHDLPVPDEFADAGEFHSALANELQNDPSLISNPVSKATTGGAQTGELDLRASPAKRAFAELVDAALQTAVGHYQAQGLEDHPIMLPAAPEWSLRAWGTVIHAGGQQAAHMHPLGWLSAVYYVALPDDMAADTALEEPGYLEFGRPPPRMYSKEKPASRSIEPRTGRLVIFPSWFWHRTLPFAAQGPRISIALDVIPKNRLRPI